MKKIVIRILILVLVYFIGFGFGAAYVLHADGWTEEDAFCISWMGQSWAWDINE